MFKEKSMLTAIASTTKAKSFPYPEEESSIRTDLAACYRLAAYFRMACQAQVAALSSGVAPLRAAPEAMAKTAQILHDNRAKADTRHWPPLLRMLDRTDPSYRN